MLRASNLVMTGLAAATALLATMAAGQQTPEAELAYTQALDKRAAGVLEALRLDDGGKAARVRQLVIDQYRGLRQFQEEGESQKATIRGRVGLDDATREAQLRSAETRAEEAAARLNDRFLELLAVDLAPEKVDRVKDVMTYNKLQVTYKGYLEMLPELTPAQKRSVYGMLVKARDRAVYAGSAEEKSAIFNTFKGRINNELAAQGYDLKAASERWAERRVSDQ